MGSYGFNIRELGKEKQNDCRDTGIKRNVSPIENRAARAGMICQVQKAVSTVKEAVHLFFSSAGKGCLHESVTNFDKIHISEVSWLIEV